MSIDWLDVATSMRAVMRDGGSRVVDHPGGGFVQWADAPGGRLHVEASDGGDYTKPMARYVVEALVAAGWAPPDEQLRNCWFQLSEDSDVRAGGRPGAGSLVGAGQATGPGAEPTRLTRTGRRGGAPVDRSSR